MNIPCIYKIWPSCSRHKTFLFKGNRNRSRICYKLKVRAILVPISNFVASSNRSSSWLFKCNLNDCNVAHPDKARGDDKKRFNAIEHGCPDGANCLQGADEQGDVVVGAAHCGTRARGKGAVVRAVVAGEEEVWHKYKWVAVFSWAGSVCVVIAQVGPS